MKENDVFISYSRDDSFAEASAIYYALISKGFSVFLDTSSMNYGDFPSQLTSAIKSSSFVVFIVSNSSVEKIQKPADSRESFIRNELKLAIENDITIIPVWFDKDKKIDEYFKDVKNTSPSADFSLDISDSTGKCSTIELDAYITKLQSINITSSDLHGKISNLAEKIGRGVYRDSLVEVLIDTLKRDCMANTISEFLLDIDEFDIPEGSAVHILSNNLQDYDLTVVSLIATSTNIKNGVKYIYYYPSSKTQSTSDDLLTLENKIKGFLCRKKDSNYEIERWIRGFYLKNYFDKEAIVDKIDDLKSQLEDDHLKDDLIDLQDDLEKWFDGDKAIKLNSLFDSIEYLNDSIKEPSWASIYSSLQSLLNLSSWILDPKAQESTRKLKNFMRRSLGIHTRITEWLFADSASEKKCNEFLKNLIFVPFSEKDCTIRPCYNFSILTDRSGAVTYASWYAASSVKKNALDNTVFYNNLEKPETRGILKSCFLRILQQEQKNDLIGLLNK